MHRRSAIALSLLVLLPCGAGPADAEQRLEHRSLLPDRPPRVATFKLKSEFSLDIRAGSRQVRIWLPLPQADPDSPHPTNSKVANLRIYSHHAYSFETDSEGNRILYVFTIEREQHETACRRTARRDGGSGRARRGPSGG